MIKTVMLYVQHYIIYIYYIYIVKNCKIWSAETTVLRGQARPSCCFTMRLKIKTTVITYIIPLCRASLPMKPCILPQVNNHCRFLSSSLRSCSMPRENSQTLQIILGGMITVLVLCILLYVYGMSKRREFICRTTPNVNQQMRRLDQFLKHGRLRNNKIKTQLFH